MALAVVRSRVGLVAVLFALAALAWWWTADSMRGMDQAPGAALGTLGWFVGVWVVMMAAMMLPSAAPTVALYSRLAARRGPGAPIAFTTGYLLAWGAAGLGAYAAFDAGHRLLGAQLAWTHGGRWLAGGALLAAAAYQATPLKDACLAKCRSPLGLLLGARRGGLAGGLGTGLRAGTWCIGCCWALMVSLFALGVMNLGWMALVAGVIAAEKTLPWARTAAVGTAVLLLALAVLVLGAPDALPGFTVPGSGVMGMH